MAEAIEFDASYRDQAMSNLMRSLRGQGGTAELAVPVSLGRYPHLGSFGNELLVVRDRALTLGTEHADVWKRRSGNELGRSLRRRTERATLA